MINQQMIDFTTTLQNVINYIFDMIESFITALIGLVDMLITNANGVISFITLNSGVGSMIQTVFNAIPTVMIQIFILTLITGFIVSVARKGI